jgi:hypothetical protein
MAAGMRNVADPQKVIDVMVKSTGRLQHVPYCGWRKGAKKKHRFGVLRMWPKWKVLRKIWKARSEAREPENRNLTTAELGFPETVAEIPEKLTDAIGDLSRALATGMRSGNGDGKAKELEEVMRSELSKLMELLQICEEPDPWAMMKWRPLVSFAGHYLKKLLGLLGKFSIFSLRVLGVGLGVSAPRAILEQFHDFNAGIRTVEMEHESKDEKKKKCKSELTKAELRRLPKELRAPERVRSRTLGRRIKDISNFFTEIPRKEFQVKLEVLLDLLRKENEDWRFF